MTTPQEKLVVRVSLGAATTASSTELPDVKTEQHWHWRRIAGAVLTLFAAAVLFYAWLHIESPDVLTTIDTDVAPTLSNTEPVESAIPDLVLEAVQQDSEPQGAVLPVTQMASSDSTATSSVMTSAEATDLAALSDAAVNAAQGAEPTAAETADIALFSSDSGVLRLALLTDEAPSAKARNISGQVDAAVIKQLALYSEVKGLNGQAIEHLWYYEGKLMTRITLPVKLDYWRTYSRKEFDPSQKGEWRVEILDPQQNLLFSHHFHYQ